MERRARQIARGDLSAEFSCYHFIEIEPRKVSFCRGTGFGKCHVHCGSFSGNEVFFCPKGRVEYQRFRHFGVKRLHTGEGRTVCSGLGLTLCLHGVTHVDCKGNRSKQDDGNNDGEDGGYSVFLGTSVTYSVHVVSYSAALDGLDCKGLSRVG